MLFLDLQIVNSELSLMQYETFPFLILYDIAPMKGFLDKESLHSAIYKKSYRFTLNKTSYV